MATRKKPEIYVPEQRILLPIKSRRAHRVKSFAEKYMPVPEGKLVGQQMSFLPEQDDFIEGVYGNTDSDGKLITRRGIFSCPRKNGKTGLIAPILGAHLIGPEAKRNSQLISAARSRDQAALVFNYLAKSLRLNPKLDGLVEIVDSSKRIRGLAMNTEFKALSADATTAHGLSPALSIHDELGQVVGPIDALYDAIETAAGAQDEPLSLIISTQAPNDADLLSTLIDDALRNPTPENVVRLYSLAKEADIFDEALWPIANFALDHFRSRKELKEAVGRAKRLPHFEATLRNLYFNQRVSLLALLVAPSTWAANSAPVDDDIFFSGLPVHIGGDLSQSRDLTSVVLSCLDPDTKLVHVKCFTYTPLNTLEERAKQDRAPYPTWVRQGHLIALPGQQISYNMVAAHLAANTAGMNIGTINFDRWRLSLFRKACEEEGFGLEVPDEHWVEVGQGFRDMSPRIDRFEEVLFEDQLAHGNNPVLNMAAGNAIVTMDPAKNRKIDKFKSSARIDPMVALVMSVYAATGPAVEGKSPKHSPVTDSSFFFV